MVYKVVGHLVHAFIYADDVPWPVEAGGTGLTRRDQAADRVTPFVLYEFLLFTRICFETRGHLLRCVLLPITLLPTSAVCPSAALPSLPMQSNARSMFC